MTGCNYFSSTYILSVFFEISRNFSVYFQYFWLLFLGLFYWSFFFWLAQLGDNNKYLKSHLFSNLFFYLAPIPIINCFFFGDLLLLWLIGERCWGWNFFATVWKVLLFHASTLGFSEFTAIFHINSIYLNNFYAFMFYLEKEQRF